MWKFIVNHFSLPNDKCEKCGGKNELEIRLPVFSIRKNKMETRTYRACNSRVCWVFFIKYFNSMLKKVERKK